MKKLLAILFFISAAICTWFDWQATISLAERFRFAKIGEVWVNWHFDSWQAIQPTIEKYVGPWLWEWVVFPTLLAPLAPVLLLIAILFWLWGRKKKRKSMFY